MLTRRNTKTGIYLDAVGSSAACQRVIDSTPSPHSVDRLKEIDRDETCQLSLAGDMVMMLIEGLLRLYGGVEKRVDQVDSAELEVSTSTRTGPVGTAVVLASLRWQFTESPRRTDVRRARLGRSRSRLACR